MIVNSRPARSRKIPGIGLFARKIIPLLSPLPNAVAVIFHECNPRSGPALGREAAQGRRTPRHGPWAMPYERRVMSLPRK